jgi:hypothetical protein
MVEGPEPAGGDAVDSMERRAGRSRDRALPLMRCVMRSFQLHASHLHRDHVASDPHHPHHPHHPLSYLMGRLEGAADYLVIVGIVALGAAMAYGLATASGRAPWF